ncbi:NAD-dependent epimerase/dehydratase family protein [bacterium 1xD8-48]|nr:NAD-dependent epimerase/dehydratase family protein [bacterium 1xD8-48]
MYLVIGASSFIGRHLYNYCKARGIDIKGTYYSHPYDAEWIKFDVCLDDLEELCYNYLNGKVPEAIILCGANANIDECKRNEEASYLLNVSGTKKILAKANKLGIKSVFLSSEAVFDGRKGMYTEEDIPNPITLYGRQKLQIEQYMIENLNDYLIFRISRATGSSFGEKDIFDDFYSKIVNQEEIVCLKNQSFSLTEVDDITSGIIGALECRLTGLYHVSSNNFVSRYELANLYADKIFGGYEKIMEKEYGKFDFWDNRHIYGGLRGDKLTHLLGMQYLTIIEILEKYLHSYERRISSMIN